MRRCLFNHKQFWCCLALVSASFVASESSASAATITIGLSGFSGSQTVLTFEDLSGSGADLPAGYGSGSGVQFSTGTKHFDYSSYGGFLVTEAAAEGLGDTAATWGVDGTAGTGFALSTPQSRVGFFTGSNVAITTTVSAFLGATLLGTQVINLAANDIEFFGFEDLGGIDRIEFGDNVLCTGCIHQLDNVMFETAGGGGSVPEPSSMLLLGTCILGAGVRHWRQRRA